MPLPLTISCSSKSILVLPPGFTFLLPSTVVVVAVVVGIGIEVMDNHLWEVFWWSLKGGWFCGESKITISHWQSRSLLMHYHTASDNVVTTENLLLSRGSVATLCTWYQVQSINTTVKQLSVRSVELLPSLTLVIFISVVVTKQLSAMYSRKLTALMLGKTRTVYKKQQQPYYDTLSRSTGVEPIPKETFTQ